MLLLNQGTPNRAGERGASAVLVAVAILVLFAFVSFAIDLGLAFDERRDAQNAADNAALAAAYEDCNPADAANENPVAAGTKVATENGFTDGVGGASVTIAADGSGWRATISVDQDTTFGGATPFAPDSITPGATALAECVVDVAPGPYAVFAGAQSCQGDELNISGSSIYVDGNIHTNGESNITGDSDPFSDPTYGVSQGEATYRQDPVVGYPATYDPRLREYPIDVTLADIISTSGGWTVHTYTGSNANQVDTWIGGITSGAASNSYASGVLTINVSGVYYSPVGMKTGATIVIPSGVNVTFASPALIDLGAVNHQGGNAYTFPGVTPPTGVFIYSDHPGAPACVPSTAAIKVNGSDLAWNGVIFAPNGTADISAAQTLVSTGAVIGYQVSLSGSTINIVRPYTTSNAPDYILNLVG